MANKDRHYHRLSILDLDPEETDDIWTEVYHAHEGGRKGHGHPVELSVAFIRVDKKLR